MQRRPDGGGRGETVGGKAGGARTGAEVCGIRRSGESEEGGAGKVGAAARWEPSRGRDGENEEISYLGLPVGII